MEHTIQMAAQTRSSAGKQTSYKFIDLFCGIGGFRVAGDSLGWQCVFSCDINPDAQRAYAANYGETPHGDIREVQSEQVPDHDILCAGFPCQPFSIIGDRKGFADTRGTLFFEIARILESKRPRAFVLENVKQLSTHNKGRTLKRILEVLRELNYTVEYRILNALNFGLPQKRERILIVGIRDDFRFAWPVGNMPMKSLSDVLEKEVSPEFFASRRIQLQRKKRHTSQFSPAIWHENKGGNVNSHPFSCALRAGASYNYLLVDGVRRLTPREMLRLQGFPESFQIVCNYTQTRQQAGNAVPVPMVRAVLNEVDIALRMQTDDSRYIPTLQPHELQGRLIHEHTQNS